MREIAPKDKGIGLEAMPAGLRGKVACLDASEASLGDAFLELVDASARLRACDDHVLCRDVELLFDGCCLAGLLGAAELIGLSEADDKLNSLPCR